MQGLQRPRGKDCWQGHLVFRGRSGEDDDTGVESSGEGIKASDEEVEGGGRDEVFPCTPSPPQIRAGSPGGKELTGTKQQQRKSGRSGRLGSQQRAGRRKSMVGEGPGKNRENGRLQEAPGSNNLLLGLPLSPGTAGAPPGTAQAGSSARSPEINYTRPPWSY